MFSGPGSLRTYRVPRYGYWSRVCALAATPARAAVASAEPIPIMLLLEKPRRDFGLDFLIMLPPFGEGRFLVEPLRWRLCSRAAKTWSLDSWAVDEHERRHTLFPK